MCWSHVNVVSPEKRRVTAWLGKEDGLKLLLTSVWHSSLVFSLLHTVGHCVSPLVFCHTHSISVSFLLSFTFSCSLSLSLSLSFLFLTLILLSCSLFLLQPLSHMFSKVFLTGHSLQHKEHAIWSSSACLWYEFPQARRSPGVFTNRDRDTGTLGADIDHLW